MTVGMLQAAFGWCSLINVVLFLWWFLMLMVARDWIYRMHSRWFKLSVEAFDRIHYAGIAFFKILIFVFNIVPYFALRIVGAP